MIAGTAVYESYFEVIFKAILLFEHHRFVQVLSDGKIARSATMVIEQTCTVRTDPERVIIRFLWNT